MLVFFLGFEFELMAVSTDTPSASEMEKSTP